MEIKTFEQDVKECVSNHAQAGLVHEELENFVKKTLRFEHAKQNRSFQWTQKNLNVLKRHIVAALGHDEDYLPFEQLNKIRKELGEKGEVNEVSVKEETSRINKHLEARFQSKDHARPTV